MVDNPRLSKCLDNLPKSQELRDRLSENLREAKLIRQLLKITEQGKRVKEAAAK